MRSTVRIIVSLAAVIVGSALLVAGATLLIVFGPDAKVGATATATTPSSAWLLVVDRIDAGLPRFAPVDSVTVSVEPLDGGTVFVGWAPRADAVSYLAGVPYEVASGVDGRTATPAPSSFDGAGIPAPPVDQAFWISRTLGSEPLVLRPDAAGSAGAVVVMNANGEAPVSVRWTIEVAAGWVPATAAIALGIGALVAAAGLWAMFGRRRAAQGPASAPPDSTSRAETGEWGSAPIRSDESGPAAPVPVAAEPLRAEARERPATRTIALPSGPAVAFAAGSPRRARGRGPDAPPREPGP